MPQFTRKIKLLTNKKTIPLRTHLDFGCGSQPRNPFGAEKLITLDVYRSSPGIPTDLIEPGDSFPFRDNSISSVSAYDVVEHLSRDSSKGNQFIFYMKEIYRVLEPGGLALIIFPAFPHRDAFSDPTHINYITPRTVDYFIGNQFPPFYADIDTNFELLLNKPLRFWKKWVVNSALNSENSSLGVRRKISLAKRTVMRFLFPQHRIWILMKPHER